jgi:thiol-disulfide isomerase/thioredoxin
MDGQTVTEDIFEEKPLTFINYWATWCGPCRNELPEFDAMVEKYGDKVSFVTIIDDGAGNADAAELVDRYLSGYTNLLPTASLVEPLQSGYVPTSIFVARGGNIVVFDGEYGGGYQLVGSYGDYSEFIDAALGIVGAQ